MRYVVRVEDRSFVVEVHQGAITIDGQVHAVDLRRIEPLSLYSLLVDHLSHEVYIEARENRYGAMLRGKLYEVEVHNGRAWERELSRPARLTAGSEVSIDAPMPGLILEVCVTADQAAQTGDVLVVLESMKMKTDIRCPHDGTVRAVHVAAHEHVTQGQPLVTVSLS